MKASSAQDKALVLSQILQVIIITQLKALASENHLLPETA
jgi:hypothetical protein